MIKIKQFQNIFVKFINFIQKCIKFIEYKHELTKILMNDNFFGNIKGYML